MVLLQVLVMCLGFSGLFLAAKYSARTEKEHNRTPREFFSQALSNLAALLCNYIMKQPLLCFLVVLFLYGAEYDPVARGILYILLFAVLAGLCMPFISALLNETMSRSEREKAPVPPAAQHSKGPESTDGAASEGSRAGEV